MYMFCVCYGMVEADSLFVCFGYAFLFIVHRCVESRRVCILIMGVELR